MLLPCTVTRWLFTNATCTWIFVCNNIWAGKTFSCLFSWSRSPISCLDHHVRVQTRIVWTKPEYRINPASHPCKTNDKKQATNHVLVQTRTVWTEPEYLINPASHPCKTNDKNRHRATHFYEYNRLTSSSLQYIGFTSQLPVLYSQENHLIQV